MSRKALIIILIVCVPIHCFLLYATYFTNSRSPQQLWSDMTTVVYTMRVEVQIDESALPPAKSKRQITARSIDTVFAKRIEEMGYVLQASSVDEERGTFTYEITNVSDTGGVFRVFAQPGNLAFYNTYEVGEVFRYLEEANTKLVDIIAAGKIGLSGSTGPMGAIAPSTGDELFGTTKFEQGQQEVKVPDKSVGEELFGGEKNQDSALKASNTEEVDNAVPVLNELHNPLFTLLYPNVVGTGKNQRLAEGPIVGQAFAKDTAVINTYLSLEPIRKMFPADLKLMWSMTGVGEGKNVFQLFAIRHYPQLPPPITGEMVKTSVAGFSMNGMPEVQLNLNIQGAHALERMTADAVNQYPLRCMAITIDGAVITAPRVKQCIRGGRSQIDMDSYEQADQIASTIASGRLPANVSVTVKAINRKSFHLPYKKKDPFEKFRDLE